MKSRLEEPKLLSRKIVKRILRSPEKTEGI